jgi:DnaJ-class molecular chaperone
MKIKINRTQWEAMGKQAGWAGTKKTAQAESCQEPDFKKECKRCHGEGHVSMKLMNHGTKEEVDSIVSCPMCNGKGYCNQSDREAYYHSVSDSPCPFGNDCTHKH